MLFDIIRLERYFSDREGEFFRHLVKITLVKNHVIFCCLLHTSIEDLLIFSERAAKRIVKQFE